MIYCGIDPGLSGAVGFINEKGEFLAVYDTPSVKVKAKGRQYHIPDMVKIFTEPLAGEITPKHEQHHIFVCVEVQQAYPKQGVSSSFKTGQGYGLWQGIVAGLGFRRCLVRPREWMKLMLQANQRGDKNAHRMVAQELWPNAELSRVKDHGRSEALLLAEYLRRTTNFEQQEAQEEESPDP